MRALRISSGVIVWALHIAAIYGFSALACARGFGGLAPWAVGVATILAAALALLVVIRNVRSDEFTEWMTAAVAAFALLAILWQGLPALMVPACV